MGRWHAHAVNAIGRKVTAVVDDDITRASLLADKYGALASTNQDEAFSQHPVAAHICTPPSSHSAIAANAISHGINLLIEKPFTPSIADTTTLLSLAADAGVIACPVHQLAFQTGTRAAMTRVRDFGPLLHVDFVACSAGAEGRPELRNQLALEILPHPLSVLHRFVTGPLCDAAWRATASSPGEVRITGESDGVTIGILISAAGRPTRNTARLIGQHGTFHLDFFHGFATFESPAVSRTRKAARPFEVGARLFAGAANNLARRALLSEPAYPGLRTLTRDFYQALDTGTEPPIGAVEILDISKTTDLIAGLLR